MFVSKYSCRFCSVERVDIFFFRWRLKYFFYQLYTQYTVQYIIFFDWAENFNKWISLNRINFHSALIEKIKIRQTFRKFDTFTYYLIFGSTQNSSVPSYFLAFFMHRINFSYNTYIRTHIHIFGSIKCFLM